MKSILVPLTLIFLCKCRNREHQYGIIDLAWFIIIGPCQEPVGISGLKVVKAKEKAPIRFHNRTGSLQRQDQWNPYRLQ